MAISQRTYQLQHEQGRAIRINNLKQQLGLFFIPHTIIMEDITVGYRDSKRIDFDLDNTPSGSKIGSFHMNRKLISSDFINKGKV